MSLSALPVRFPVLERRMIQPAANPCARCDEQVSRAAAVQYHGPVA